MSHLPLREACIITLRPQESFRFSSAEGDWRWRSSLHANASCLTVKPDIVLLLVSLLQYFFSFSKWPCSLQQQTAPPVTFFCRGLDLSVVCVLSAVFGKCSKQRERIRSCYCCSSHQNRLLCMREKLRKEKVSVCSWSKCVYSHSVPARSLSLSMSTGL